MVGVLLLAAAAVCALPAPASGQTIPVARALAGNGFGDAYGIGVGGSAGLEVPFIRGKRFFVGLRGVYHFGSDGVLDDFTSDGDTALEGEVSQFQAGVEIGATWMSSPLFIRTVGGVGLARVEMDLESGRSDLEGSNTKLQYGPGLLIAVPSSDGTFAGLEIRWLKVSDLDSALSIYLTLGRRFL